MAKKNLQAKVYIALWMVLLVALGVYYAFFAPRDGAYSEAENRTLTAFPETSAEHIFNGDFGVEFENYLIDHFPGRNTVISTVNRLQSMMSLATHDEYLLIAEDVDDPLVDEIDQAVLDALLEDLNKQTEPSEEPTQAPTEATQPEQTESAEPLVTEPVEDPPIVPKPEAKLEDFPHDMGLYIDTGDGPVALRSYTRASVGALTAVLNKFAQRLPENGKLIFTVGPPSYLVQRFVAAENKVSFEFTWDDAVNALGDDNVYAVDSAKILSKAIREGKYVSFRNDNHWTPHGAYLVYREMASLAGKELCTYPDDFDITVEENFKGTYYRDNPSAYWNVEADTLELVMPKIGVEYREITSPDHQYKVIDFLNLNAHKSDRYAVYLSGPGGPWRYVQCDNDQTENCLVVTDSFGLTVIPYLTSNYNQIHYYDARYFYPGKVGYSIEEMIELYDIQDIYVIVADFHSFNSEFLISTANYHLTLGR